MAHVKLAVLCFLAAGLLAGCGASDTPTPPAADPTPTPGLRQVSVGPAFTLGVGEQVELAGQQVLITFEGVTADSRCAVDVVCVRAGEATSSFLWTAAGGTPQGFELRFGEAEDTDDQFWPFVVRVTDVQPLPVSTVPIDASAYRVTVQITVDR